MLGLVFLSIDFFLLPILTSLAPVTASVTSSPASTLVYACYVVGTAPPLPDFMASFVVGDCSYLFVIVPSLVRKYTI